MIKHAGATALCIAVIAGCSGAPTEAPQPSTPATEAAAPAVEQSEPMAEAAAVPTELVGSWTLVAMDGGPVPGVGTTPQLEIFPDGSVAGVGGVNRLRSQLDIAEDRVSFGPVAGTKMAGPPAAMELENTFIERLDAVGAYEISDDTLRLWAGDAEALTFERTNEAED